MTVIEPLSLLSLFPQLRKHKRRFLAQCLLQEITDNDGIIIIVINLLAEREGAPCSRWQWSREGLLSEFNYQNKRNFI